MPDEDDPKTDTATPLAARAHALAMAGTRVDAMPTMPPGTAEGLPPEIDPTTLLWDEVVAGGGYTSIVVPRGARVRLFDRDGDACAGVLLHRADRTAERLNVADTVKVQWQAYVGAGHLLLTDMGRVIASIVEDTAGRVDAFTGTSNRLSNEERYGDGAPDGSAPNGRDHFAVALAKRGMSRRDIAPNVNFFKGVEIAPDGHLGLVHGDGSPGHVVLRCELDAVVSIVNVPHPLDDRDDYTVSPLRVTAWAGLPAAADDPIRTAGPEAERAYMNTEAEAAVTRLLGGGT